MSRIGKTPVLIPNGVAVTLNGNDISVKGPKGTLEYKIRPEIKATLSDNALTFEIVKATKESNAYFGLTRALIANMVKGVSNGFEKKLELVGVGYRVKLEGTSLSLTLGYSHPIIVPAPLGITFQVPDNTTIIISGFDKALVGLTAAKIRKLRKPEPYKGKGIKYEGEKIRRKAGKAGKA